MAINWDVISICIAYEQGFGDGLDNRTKPNPYTPGTNNFDAWNYGYETGNSKNKYDEGLEDDTITTN